MANNSNNEKKTAAAFYGVAVVWVGYAILFGLHSASDFLIAIVLSVVAFALLGNASPALEEEAEAGTEAEGEADAAGPVEKEPESTGNEELDRIIRDGALAISEMRRLNDNIEDEKISADIERLEKSSKAIFDQVSETPEKIPQILKFMDYYLPTTLKLLNAYDRMSAAGISGENINATKLRVENMMSSIVTAFEKQYDALFGAEALDISTDISVLETMMVREGFAGEHLEAETTKNADGTDIKLEM